MKLAVNRHRPAYSGHAGRGFARFGTALFDNALHPEAPGTGIFLLYTQHLLEQRQGKLAGIMRDLPTARRIPTPSEE